MLFVRNIDYLIIRSFELLIKANYFLFFYSVFILVVFIGCGETAMNSPIDTSEECYEHSDCVTGYECRFNRCVPIVLDNNGETSDNSGEILNNNTNNSNNGVQVNNISNSENNSNLNSSNNIVDPGNSGNSGNSVNNSSVNVHNNVNGSTNNDVNSSNNNANNSSNNSTNNNANNSSNNNSNSQLNNNINNISNNNQQSNEILCDGNPITCSGFILCNRGCNSDQNCLRQCLLNATSECQQCLQVYLGCARDNGCVDAQDNSIDLECVAQFCNSEEMVICLGPIPEIKNCTSGLTCTQGEIGNFCLENGHAPSNAESCDPDDLCSCNESDVCFKKPDGTGACVSVCSSDDLNNSNNSVNNNTANNNTNNNTTNNNTNNIDNDLVCSGEYLKCQIFIQCTNNCANNDDTCFQQCFDNATPDCRACYSEVVQCVKDNNCVDETSGVVNMSCAAQYCNTLETKTCLGPLLTEIDCAANLTCTDIGNGGFCMEGDQSPSGSESCDPLDLCSCSDNFTCVSDSADTGVCLNLCNANGISNNNSTNNTDNNTNNNDGLTCNGVPIKCEDYLLCTNDCTNGDDTCFDACFDNTTPDCRACYMALIQCVSSNNCADSNGNVDMDCTIQHCNGDETRTCIGPFLTKKTCPSDLACEISGSTYFCLENGYAPSNAISCDPNDLCECPNDDICAGVSTGGGVCVTLCDSNSN